eukprot:2785665-Rhodomonas_salina.6
MACSVRGDAMPLSCYACAYAMSGYAATRRDPTVTRPCSTLLLVSAPAFWSRHSSAGHVTAQLVTSQLL